jgi:VIT1/CCC1 family predicted Fe2+/Mn2+ transporter
MAIEEARNTEVSITRTERGRYGNAHIRYDINDGLVDVILEVTPTEEQRAERVRDQKDQKAKRRNDERDRTRNKGKIQTKT